MYYLLRFRVSVRRSTVYSDFLFNKSICLLTINLLWFQPLKANVWCCVVCDLIVKILPNRIAILCTSSTVEQILVSIFNQRTLLHMIYLHTEDTINILSFLNTKITDERLCHWVSRLTDILIILSSEQKDLEIWKFMMILRICMA